MFIMNIRELNIAGMTGAYAGEIAQWRYDGIYAFYNRKDSQTEGLMDGTHYACTDAHGKLIGYFCFGDEARIPTIEENVYEADYLDVGLGLRPELCGKGFGTAFVNLGLAYAQTHPGIDKFRLSVAAFNERAVRVYQKAGFAIVHEVTNAYFKNKFYIMTNTPPY